MYLYLGIVGTEEQRNPKKRWSVRIYSDRMKEMWRFYRCTATGEGEEEVSKEDDDK